MSTGAGKAPGGVRADRPQSYQSVEKVASHVRHLIAPEVPVNKALPGQVLFENLHKYVVKVGGKVTEWEPAVEAMSPGIEGATRYDAPRNKIVISLSEATYEALEQDNRRARFSFAHEVGHAALHHQELMRSGSIAHQMAALYRGEALPHNKCMDTEWQANAFAAALLMPAVGLAEVEEMHGALTDVLVSTCFKVSMPAARYRIEHFEARREQLLSP